VISQLSNMSKFNIEHMRYAKTISLRSIDPSRKVGAIAVIDNDILITSYNRFVSGIAETHERYTNKELKYKYIIHAEQRLIYNACKTDESLKNTTVYVYGLGVCSECAKGLIEVGVKEVYSMGIINDRWKSSIDDAVSIFNEANVMYQHFNEELGGYNE
jgi:dCMP deaminase